MSLISGSREQVGPVDAGQHRVDLNDIWAAAGRPKGKSPRQWARSSLVRAAVALFAGRQCVGTEAVSHDPGGPKAQVLADVASGAPAGYDGFRGCGRRPQPNTDREVDNHDMAESGR